jgi:hypothetical protein
MNLRSLFPRASLSFLKANETHSLPQLPHPIPQHHQPSALDKTTTRETQGLDRTLVRFTGYRVRPLDPDNFAGSVKGLLDGLKYAHLIQGDEPWRIILQTTQEKVNSFAQERTMIQIDPILMADDTLAKIKEGK